MNWAKIVLLSIYGITWIVSMWGYASKDEAGKGVIATIFVAAMAALVVFAD